MLLLAINGRYSYDDVFSLSEHFFHLTPTDKLHRHVVTIMT